MKVTKVKIKKGLWRFLVGKTSVAITKKKKSTYSLTWKVKGLLKIVRKRGMEGVTTGSEWLPADFTNYTQSKTSFSSNYIKSTIRDSLKDYHNRVKLYKKQHIDLNNL